MKESNGIKTVKKVIGLIGGVGVATIVGNAVKHVSPTTGAGIAMKICVGIGTALLGGLACEATSKYADKQIDEVAEVAEEFFKDTPEDVIDAEVVENA